MLTLGSKTNQDRTIVYAVSISHALTATASWKRWMCEPFTGKGRGWVVSSRTDTTMIRGRGKVWRKAKETMVL
jgi:hypothetical protein